MNLRSTPKVAFALQCITPLPWLLLAYMDKARQHPASNAIFGMHLAIAALFAFTAIQKGLALRKSLHRSEVQ